MKLRFAFSLGLVVAVSSCADASPEAIHRAPEPSPEGTDVPGPGPSTEAPESYEWALTTTPGRPRVIAETKFDPDAMAIDETHIYWSAGGAGILRVRKTGGPIETFLRPEYTASIVLGLAVDADAVYWTDLVGGRVSKRSKEGGPIEVLASEQIRPWGLALDATRVYWTNQGESRVGAPGDDGEIRAVDKKGGTPATLVSALSWPTTVAVDSDSIYYSVGGYAPGSDEYGRVFRLSKAGGAPETLARNTGAGPALTARGGSVYFVASVGSPEGPQGSLFRASAGQAPVRLDPDVLTGTTALALGDDSVFYTNFDTQTRRGEIRRVPIDRSSPPRVVAQRQYPKNASAGGPTSMGVDADNVYWVDFWWSYEPQEKGSVFAAPLEH